MKKFIIYLIKKILIFGIVLIMLDLFYTYIYENKQTIRTKIEFIFQNNDKKYDYIFLGSSRVEFHVNTTLIDKKTGKKSLNLGISGQNLPETFLTLKLLRKQNISAKKYFIQIDEADLIKKSKKNFSSVSYFLPYTKNKEINDHLKEYDLDYFEDTKIPFYRYMNYGYKIGYRELLLKIANKKRMKNFYIGLESLLENDTISNNFKNNYSTELLNEISHFGIEKNIEIIFYTSPYYNVKNDTHFKEVLKKKTIFDYIDSITNPKLFKDADHLNKHGANKFTEMLIRDYNLKN